MSEVTCTGASDNGRTSLTGCPLIVRESEQLVTRVSQLGPLGGDVRHVEGRFLRLHPAK